MPFTVKLLILVEYMGHKLHMDQNEKLVMFEVTHMIAVDGYCKKIVANATMPVKNNLAIYEEVYRSVLYVLFDRKYLNQF